MAADTGQAEGSAPATQPAGSAAVLARVEHWHHDLVSLVDAWG